jgi:hypothetical protein
MNYESYQQVIDDTEQYGNPREAVPRYEVRREVQTYKRRSKHSKGRELKKARYYVVDNYEAEVIHESRWDIPNDHNSDGVADYCRGLASGLRRNEDE